MGTDVGKTIKGTIPCELFGGPLDGAKYGDLPDFGTPMTNVVLTVPLGQPAAAYPSAVYVCRGAAPVHGLWQFFYERTEAAEVTDVVDLPIPHPPFPSQPAPVGTGLSTKALADAATQVAIARAIATVAHRDQTDKSGAPYITHPARVAARFNPALEWLAHCVAWLHDVIEDTPLTAADLRAAGIRDDVLEAVALLTRRPNMPASEYFRRMRENPVARAVKAADIDDNTDPRRTRHLDPVTHARLAGKYERARRSLGLVRKDAAK